MSEAICKICRSNSVTPFGEGRGHMLMVCGICGFRFIHPSPSAEELAAFYASYGANTAHGYDRKTDKKIARAATRLRKYAHLAPGKRFIDIGCSIGTACAAAQALGFSAHGIDMDADSIAFAAKHFPDGVFHTGPLEDIPPAWGQFDFIYTSEVIEHLPDPHLLMQAIGRHAAPGAFLYITAPDAGHPLVPGNLLPGSFFDWSGYVPPEHLNYFTRANMRQLLAEHGFELIRMEWNLKPGIKAVAKRI